MKKILIQADRHNRCRASIQDYLDRDSIQHEVNVLHFTKHFKSTVGAQPEPNNSVPTTDPHFKSRQKPDLADPTTCCHQD